MGFLDSSSEDSSDVSSSFGKKKAAPAPAKKSSFLDSSSDESTSKKKAAPAAKKKGSLFSSSSEDSSSKKKAAPAPPPPPPAPAPKKPLFSSSSEESSSSKKKRLAPAPAPPPLNTNSDSDASSEERSSKKNAAAPAPSPPPPTDKSSSSSKPKSVKGESDREPAAESASQQDDEVDSVSATRSAKSGQSKKSKTSSRGSKSKRSQQHKGSQSLPKGSQQGSQPKSDGSKATGAKSKASQSSQANAGSRSKGSAGGSQASKSQVSGEGPQSAKQQQTEQSQSQSPQPAASEAAKLAQGSPSSKEKSNSSGSSLPPWEGETGQTSGAAAQPGAQPQQQQGEGEILYEEVVEEEALDSNQQPIVTTDSVGFLSEDSSLTHPTMVTKRQVIEEDGVVYEVIEEVVDEGTGGTIPKEKGQSPQQPISSPQPSFPYWNRQQVQRIQQTPPPRRQRKPRRGNFSVGFRSPHVTDLLEYRQALDAPLSVPVAVHAAKEYNEIAWYKQVDYEELPWYMQPDIDEDGAVTELSERLLMASEDREENNKYLELLSQIKKQGPKKPAVSPHSSPSSDTPQVDNRLEQLSQSPGDNTGRPNTVHRSSSLLSGPESVSDGSSESSGGLEKQRTFLTASERPSRIPPPAQRRAHRRTRARKELVTPQKPSLDIRRQSPLFKEMGLDSTTHAGNLRHPRGWSVVDSGYKPKLGSTLLKSQQPEQGENERSQSAPQFLRQDRQQPSEIMRPKRHSIATMDVTRQPLSTMLNGEQPTTFDREHTQAQVDVLGPKRHSIAIMPTMREPRDKVLNLEQPTTCNLDQSPAQVERPMTSDWDQPPAQVDVFHLSSSSSVASSIEVTESTDPRQKLPIYARVVAERYHDDPAQPTQQATQPVVKIVEEDEFSVPFDEREGYEREIFQDEYYYEGLNNRNKAKRKPGDKGAKQRKTSRKISRDPPQALRDPYNRPEPMISNVVVSSPIQRNMSGLSNISSVPGYEGLHNVPSPPTDEHGAASMSPEQRARYPSTTVEVEEMQGNWNDTNGISSPVTGPEAPHAQSGPKTAGHGDRRQSISEFEGPESSGAYQFLANNVMGLVICLCLAAVWVVVLVAAFTDLGNNPESGENGGSKPNAPPTTTMPVPTVAPTLAGPPASAPTQTPQVDGG